MFGLMIWGKLGDSNRKACVGVKIDCSIIKLGVRLYAMKRLGQGIREGILGRASEFTPSR